MSNTVFWTWYFWDSLFKTAGDCPLDGNNISKMKREGVERVETRKNPQKL